MFGRFLLDQGMELELKVNIDEVLDFIDREMPRFTCEDYGYDVISGKGVLHSQWKLVVKPRDLKSSTVMAQPVGYLMVEKLDDYITSFKVPPRSEWGKEREMPSDLDVKLFTSFILQTLNVFQSRGYIQLPGVLPVA